MKTKVKVTGQARLFRNPVLEFFTKASFLESTLTSWGLAIFCCWLGFRWGAVETAGGAAALFGIGLLSWSISEYFIHRYLFHLAEDAFRGSARFQYLIHGVHHEYPNDAQRTLLPFMPKIILASFFFGLFYLLMGPKGAFFSAGFSFGYYLYSMMHYSIHRFRPPSFLKPLWEHHHLHHHLPEGVAYGVSSMLWDRVFGTMPPKFQKKTTVVEVSAEAAK